jgi:hypothetical protein
MSQEKLEQPKVSSSICFPWISVQALDTFIFGFHVLYFLCYWSFVFAAFSTLERIQHIFMLASTHALFTQQAHAEKRRWYFRRYMPHVVCHARCSNILSCVTKVHLEFRLLVNRFGMGKAHGGVNARAQRALGSCIKWVGFI